MALTDETIFINTIENIRTVLLDSIGETIMDKSITYVFGSQVSSDVEVPAIAVEDGKVDLKRTYELGGRHITTIDYTVWVHAGGFGKSSIDEGMKQQLKGLMYSAFSKKQSLPFYNYMNGGNVEGYYSTDISLRSSTPSIYSKLDAHKFIGNLTVEIIY